MTETESSERTQDKDFWREFSNAIAKYDEYCERKARNASWREFSKALAKYDEYCEMKARNAFRTSIISLIVSAVCLIGQIIIFALQILTK